MALAKLGVESEGKATLDERVSIDVTSLDKQQRRDVHSVIRRCFPGLISNTKAKEDGTRAMDVFLQSAAKSLKDKKAIGAARWPEGKHKFLQ